MLKVVGASWLQTRISTYILVAVGLLGIGAILLGEFGSDEKDGTYSATVFWNHKGGCRIDFWGQGNDLVTLPRGAARAYYKTRIQETGWSIVEIETSPSYPDAVQAYAAGLLEGSLTWQLIHHHWYNTIGTMCALEANEELCTVMRQRLRENAAVIRERANLLASEDPFWHMVRLFYAQLDGMEAGWRFAVRRSRRSVEIESEDFLWLAMASDLPKGNVRANTVDPSSPNEERGNPPIEGRNDGVIFVKLLDRSVEGLEPLIAFAQNTVAPYAKMLRLLKRYTFGYHLSGTRHSPRAPTRSIFMSSYPGALSSHDEYYVVRGGNDNDDILILAAIPLRDASAGITSSPISEDTDQSEDNEEEAKSIPYIRGVMSPVRIMSANRLATEARTWSRMLAHGNPSKEATSTSNSLQWVTLRPKDSAVWLIDQHSSTIHAVDHTENFAKRGFVLCNGESILKTTTALEELLDDSEESDGSGDTTIGRPYSTGIDMSFVENVTSVEAIRNLMRGGAKYFDAETDEDERANVSSPHQFESRFIPFIRERMGEFIVRGDLENPPIPFGTIDNKMALVTAGGVESFEATSGPPYGHEMAAGSHVAPPFGWTKSFPNKSRIGQPDRFQFDSVIPEWIWF